MRSWLVDGEPGTTISLDDRGLAYGDGLFETIALRDARPRFFERHMRRLAEGCSRLAITAPPPDTIASEIERVRGGSVCGTVKVIVTRGTGPRGYGWVEGALPARIVGFDPDDGSRDRVKGRAVTVAYCRTRASLNPSIAGIKTLNRLDSVLARGELRAGSFDEGLMFDGSDHVVGGTMTNLFAVRDGCLMTPALRNGGVRGVMREVVLEAARNVGIECIETDMTREDLAQTGELFLTNALIGLWSVARCGDVQYRAGTVTRSIAAELYRRGVEECQQ